MVARPAKPYRSANAAEFSDDAKGRIDIKQYYSAGLRFKNIEPVPQSGFRQMGGTWRKGFARKTLASRAITGPALSAGPHTGTQTVWTGTVAGTVAAVQVTAFAASAGSVVFTVEAQVSGVWTALTGGFTVAGSAVTRTAAFAPGEQRSATALRIRATFSEAATVSIGAVAAWFETGSAIAPRFWHLKTDAGADLVVYAGAGIVDFYSVAGWRGAALVPTLTAAMLPDLEFYAEGRTIGLFHIDLETVSLFLADTATDHDWRVGLWTYDPSPLVDLGGTYAKTDDKWEVFFRWTGSVELHVSFTIDGEVTPAIPHVDGADEVIPSASFTETTWTDFAADIEAALQALPGMSSGVQVTYTVLTTGLAQKNRKMQIVFGGDLSGTEYQLSALVTNTADASALAYHTVVGKTALEPLFSTGRGWPGGMTLVQDRGAYYRIKAKGGSLALSRVAEYFDLDITSLADNAARLDNLRSQTTETILAVKDSRYLLVFTDRGVYFVQNRTIERNMPMNFVLSSEVAIAANCKPFDLEGTDYYIGRDENRGDDDPAGHQMLSIVYDDVSTAYNANPESLLASHLVTRLNGSIRQKKSGDTDAAKAWLKRSDGRLVAAQMIRNQDILGFCEWLAAQGGEVVECGVDGRNRLWISVRRGATITHELYDTAIYLHDAMTVTPDLAGVVGGLPANWEGRTVHAVADGYELADGFVVTNGSISLGDAYASAIIGLWQPPVFESMPEVFVAPNEDVILRPGRIHTAHINLIDTTSIAVGANGRPPVDIALLETGDPTDQPMAGKTKLITVAGDVLQGHMTGTTLVITQTRPGRLRIRDYAIGAKL